MNLFVTFPLKLELPCRLRELVDEHFICQLSTSKSLGDFDIRNNTLLVVLLNAVFVDEGRNWILYHCNAWQGLGKRMRRYVTGVLITPWMIMKTFQFCQSRWHSDTGKENQGSLHVGGKDETEICAQSQSWQIISSQFCCCQLKSGRTAVQTQCKFHWSFLPR